MPSHDAIRQSLRRPVDPAAIKERPNKGRLVPYVTWQYAYHRLDEATNGNWNYEIITASEQGNYAVVHLRLNLWDDDGVLQFQDEIASVPMDSQAPPFEVGTRTAVKRAMSAYGFAIDLWQGMSDDPDHYSREPEPNYGEPPSQRRSQSATGGRPRYPQPPRDPDDAWTPEQRAEDECVDCGTKVKQRQDGTYWERCYNCNQRRQAA